MMQFALAVLVLTAAAASLTPARAQNPGARRGAVPDYVIGVEDELRVVVWGESELTLKVKVRPDGKITLPLVNDVQVVGLTTEQVRTKIAEALQSYVRDPNVTVIIDQILSYRVFFIGELRRQGALNFYQPIRLLQGIAAAGGITEFGNQVIVLREAAGREARNEYDYKKLLAGTQENIVLLPGDTVIVK